MCPSMAKDPIGKPEICEEKLDARGKLLLAALRVIRAKGYSATTVDDLCREAGVTKGAFFHHFKTKDDLAVAAVDYWAEWTSAFFETAPYHDHDDPLERILAYIDFRKSMISGATAECTCLSGTMVQEVYDRNPEIRDACHRSIWVHAGTLVEDLEEAMRLHEVTLPIRAESLALHMQAVIQGAFVLAKASGNLQVARDSLDHLHHYVSLLFGLPGNDEKFAK